MFEKSLSKTYLHSDSISPNIARILYYSIYDIQSSLAVTQSRQINFSNILLE